MFDAMQMLQSPAAGLSVGLCVYALLNDSHSFVRVWCGGCVCVFLFVHTLCGYSMLVRAKCVDAHDSLTIL